MVLYLSTRYHISTYRTKGLIKSPSITPFMAHFSRIQFSPFLMIGILFFTLILPSRSACSTAFSLFFIWCYTASGLCESQHNSNRHCVDSNCNAAHHLTHTSHSETARLCNLRTVISTESLKTGCDVNLSLVPIGDEYLQETTLTMGAAGGQPPSSVFC